MQNPQLSQQQTTGGGGALTKTYHLDAFQSIAKVIAKRDALAMLVAIFAIILLIYGSFFFIIGHMSIIYADDAVEDTKVYGGSLQRFASALLSWPSLTGRESQSIDSLNAALVVEATKAMAVGVVYWCGFASFGALAAVLLPVLADPDKYNLALLGLSCSLISFSIYFSLASGFSSPAILMSKAAGSYPSVATAQHPPQLLLSWAFTTSAMIFAVWRSGRSPLRYLVLALASNVLLIGSAHVTTSLGSGVIAFWSSLLVAAGAVVGLCYSHFLIIKSRDGERMDLTDNLRARWQRMALIVAVSSISLPSVYLLLQFTGLSSFTMASAITAMNVLAHSTLVSALLLGALDPAIDRNMTCMKDTAAEAFDDLKEKNSVKDRFFSSMVHEIRTPLHGMVCLCEMLHMTEATKMSEKALTTIATIRDSGRRLQELISTILDSSSLKEAKLRLNIESFSLPEVVEDVATLIRPLLRNETKFVIDMSPNLPLLGADKLRVRQVLYNLLGNSAKFTSSGEVSVSASVEGREMRICVKDTGRSQVSLVCPRASSYCPGSFLRCCCLKCVSWT